MTDPVLVFLMLQLNPPHPAPRIDFWNDRLGRPLHAPAAIHCGNTNNYTIITSPAAPTEQHRATSSAFICAAQSAF